MKRVPVTHRRLWQTVGLFLCLTPLMGLTYLDMPNTRLVLLGIGFQTDKIIYLVVLTFAALGMLFYLSSRWGRALCIFFCPLHCTLEATIDHSRQTWLRPLLWLVPVALTQSAICFVFPYARQIALFKEAAFPQPILICHGIVLSVVMGIFWVYKERFCHSLCPYGLFQGVLRSDVTVVTTLQDPGDRCINCLACDCTCPMRLDVRQQSTESFCSNCTRCIDACQGALGPNREVITQIFEADLPDGQEGGD
jgi:polyferredoxin